MKWVILRNDGKYLAPPGQHHSYTTQLTEARVFDSRESADAERLENERVEALSGVMRGWRD